jgi:hypothetical protein
MHTTPEYRVFIYRGTGNLGDAIQTYALCRLLGTSCLGIYRDEPFPEKWNQLTLVANGWLGWRPPDVSGSSVFAGVHLGHNEGEYLRWIAKTGHTVGARDPYSASLLQRCRIPSVFIGCATLTLERHNGPRSGRYSIDVGPYEDTSLLTNEIPNLTWPQQWGAAIERLDLLRQAELVYTNRLHVALPCLAFGTPVVFPLKDFTRVGDKQRLTVLNELPFVYNEPVVADVSEIASRYIQFLANHLTLRPTSDHPLMPTPAEDYEADEGPV